MTIKQEKQPLISAFEFDINVSVELGWLSVDSVTNDHKRGCL